MSKGPDAFRTISEVAEELDLPQHVLRFWETRFAQIRPMKRGGGRRYYRPDDVELLRGIRRLLYGEGYTIKGVQRILKEQGARQVAAVGHGGRLDALPARHDDDDLGEIPDGILTDDDRPPDVRPPRNEIIQQAPVRRGFLGRGIAARPAADRGLAAPGESGAVTGQRREPVFDLPRPKASDMPVRAPVERPSDPVPQPVSRIPAAPPDEPDSAEVYLPPQVAVVPQDPPDEIDLYAKEVRRDVPPPGPPLKSEEPVPAPRLPMPAPEAGRFRPPPRPEPDPRRPAPGSAPSAPLSDDDVRLLREALVELLDCKRILDQAR